MEETSKLNEKANTEGFIVAYPDGWNYSVTANKTQSWNAYEGWAQGKDDVAFIDQNIELIGRHYNIDRNRIYATGFSNGASMCYRLGHKLSCKIAAIAPHSGYFNYWPVSFPNCRVPVLHLHGIKDGIAQYNASSVENVL
jgi:polyhydroxybutyrate depolymerase